MTVLRLTASLCLAALAGCAQISSWLPFGGGSGDSKSDASVVETPKPRHAGTLLLAGGGRIPGAVIAEAARLTGGAGTKAVVIPLGSTAQDAGKATLETWTRAGFADTEILDATDAAHAAAQIESATFIWMTGGDQVRLIGKLLDAGLAEAVHRRFEAGAIVGGTSSGAAALSELMLTGAESDEEMLQGRVQTLGGLGLWRGVIIDHRFVAKRRFNRLMAAVLDHPKFVGIGIDDGAGVVVQAGSMRVVGDGNVVVIDARGATVNASRPGDASSATNVTMQVLADGMTYDLGKR